MNFNIKMRKNKRYPQFAKLMLDIYQQTGDSWSSRGWCYILEGKGIITKSQFSKVNTWICDCIKLGYLPVDIVENDSSRMFQNIYSHDNNDDLNLFVQDHLAACNHIPSFFDPDFFKHEDVYLQVLVEKVDLIKIFSPICKKYLVPLGNARGWSSVMQRAMYTKRFKKYQDKKCILLYYGDYDPDGLRIADTLKKNIFDIKNIRWKSGATGYDPEKLVIKRIGLKKSFIKKHNLTWIDNLETGGTNKKTGTPLRLDDPAHKNHEYEYVQRYIEKNGVRKCEANSIVTVKEKARKEFEKELLKYLGENIIRKRDEIKIFYQKKIEKIMREYDIFIRLDDMIDDLQNV